MTFIDTSAWIALEDIKDSNHEKAIHYRSAIISQSSARLFTSNYVMDETLTLMLMDLGYEKTVNFKAKYTC